MPQFYFPPEDSMANVDKREAILKVSFDSGTQEYDVTEYDVTVPAKSGNNIYKVYRNKSGGWINGIEYPGNVDSKIFEEIKNKIDSLLF